uniref:Death domain-containing protein n=1 Tax=Mesocestoides corti TaxID=53468 RepID=A0A5K3FCX9_MESCO
MSLVKNRNCWILGRTWTSIQRLRQPLMQCNLILRTAISFQRPNISYFKSTCSPKGSIFDRFLLITDEKYLETSNLY